MATQTVEGHTIREIAETLSITEKTVNTYRYRLYQKLHVKNDVELTLLAIRHGLLDINALVDTTPSE